MLNRRHIRIKVMQCLYAFKGNESDDLKKDEKFLSYSLESIYELYLCCLSLLTELHKKSKSYNAKLKHKLSNLTASEYSKLEHNQVLEIISNNKLLQETITKQKLNFWDLDFEYVDTLSKLILKSDLHKNYTAEQSFKDDKQFILDIFTQIIAPNDKLFDYFEDKRLTWVDDIPVVNTLLLKLIRKIKLTSPDTIFLPNLYKDEDDKIFAKQLLIKTLLNTSKFKDIITSKTTNWDSERLASLDGVILRMAICEFQNFTSIPHKVTINEYLEIAKEYSTPKSSVFINGVLDKIAREYKADNLYPKSGRGLL